jgi:hypothetical protein
MTILTYVSARRLWLIALTLLVTACNTWSPNSAIPEVGETLTVSVILYDDEASGRIVSQCTVKDSLIVREIHDSLTPSEFVDPVKSMMNAGPVIGKIGFQGAKTITWVEFVDPGKNPLSFRIGDMTYLRGGSQYKNYQADHKRLYGLDETMIDEGRALYDKLIRLCK